MASLGTRAFGAFFRLLGADRPLRSTEAAEAFLNELALRPVSYAPPKKLGAPVDIRIMHTYPWPVYEVTPENGPCNGVVFYAHGGAWALEIQTAQWKLVAKVAAKAQTRVIVPIYPLLPRGAAGDVVARVASLTRDAVAAYGADSVSLWGDSAGGQISLSTALLLRKEGIAVRRTVLVAPAVDLAFNNPGIADVERVDPLLKATGIRVASDLWRGDLDIRDPRVSPLHGDLTGLGPLEIFSGTRDITNPDTRLLVEKARASGVSVTYHEGRDLIHVTAVLPTKDGRSIRKGIVDALRVAGSPQR